MKCVRCVAASKTILSLPVRGAWIEIKMLHVDDVSRLCRSPCGERGLKSFAEQQERKAERSLPVRGAWIEIVRTNDAELQFVRRSPCGERGLKFPAPPRCAVVLCGRSPCGERGLKCCVGGDATEEEESLPVRGAWIEIYWT